MNTIVLHNPFRPYKSPNNTGLTREELRELASLNNIPRGRNTADTIANLTAAGINIQLAKEKIFKK